MSTKKGKVMLPLAEVAIYGESELGLMVLWPDGSHTAFVLRPEDAVHKHYPILDAVENSTHVPN